MQILFQNRSLKGWSHQLGSHSAQTYAMQIGCKSTKAATRALQKSGSYGVSEHMEENEVSNKLYGSGALRAQNSSIENDAVLCDR